MSAAALFTPGQGDFHVPVSVRLADVPRGQQLAAWRVYSAIIDFLPRGQTELGERFTDRVLGQSPWLRDYSRRFIQKGLSILDELGIIRRTPCHGRRIISVIGRLRGHAKHEPKPGAQTKAKARPAAGKRTSSSIPNVGIVQDASPEFVAAVQARIAAQQDGPPEPTPQELADLERFLEESRRRREAARRPAPVNVPAPRADGSKVPGMTAQAILEAKRQAIGVRIAPEPDPGPDSPPRTAGP